MGMRSIAIEWSGSRLMASLAWATFHNVFILRIRVNHQAAAQLGGVRFLAFAVRGEGKRALKRFIPACPLQSTFIKTSSEIRRWPSTCRNNPARFAVSFREISITGEATCRSF
jgi:hypothetical protein